LIMITDVLSKLRARQDLLAEEADAAFENLFEQQLQPAQIGALLMGLAQKGESVVELTAAAKAMRARMITAFVRDDAIDVCGTGGDGAQTLNISTAVAIVVAACGVPVAKHGNRAASSQSGATDVLTALGVNINAPQAVVEACVNDLGIGYFAAPLYHPALVPLVELRKSLGVRTIFNLLGPMCNPAGVKRQMIGVAQPQLLHAFAEVLMSLGSERLVIVHGDQGLDELALSGPNKLLFAGLSAETGESVISDLVAMGPTDFSFRARPLDELRGGGAVNNAIALRQLLEGEAGAYRDVVLMNAAMALPLSSAEDRTSAENIALAAQAIDSGKAQALLDRWIEMSNKS
jgi:anthranilate phosphoribosyltransferase